MLWYIFWNFLFSLTCWIDFLYHEFILNEEQMENVCLKCTVIINNSCGISFCPAQRHCAYSMSFFLTRNGNVGGCWWKHIFNLIHNLKLTLILALKRQQFYNFPKVGLHVTVIILPLLPIASLKRWDGTAVGLTSTFKSFVFPAQLSVSVWS